MEERRKIIALDTHRLAKHPFDSGELPFRRFVPLCFRNDFLRTESKRQSDRLFMAWFA
jgi:hypothetical protein